jgi:mannose-6-phosphate isomerase-like protein (cupin superfamily)
MAATLIREAEAPRFDVHGAKVIAYASPARGSRALATWRLVLAVGVESPVHQLSVDETFIVLAGSAEYEVDGASIHVCTGDGVTVQANTSFRIRNTGTAPFEAIACVPSGCEARVEGGAPFAPPWTC